MRGWGVGKSFMEEVTFQLSLKKSSRIFVLLLPMESSPLPPVSSRYFVKSTRAQLVTARGGVRETAARLLCLEGLAGEPAPRARRFAMPAMPLCPLLQSQNSSAPAISLASFETW